MPFANPRHTSLAEKTLRSQLLGYTRPERKKELNEALRIKTKNYEEAHRNDGEMLHLLEQIIRHMRQNNLESENIIRMQGDHDRLLVRGVLSEEKRERLELGRSTVIYAVEALFNKYADKHKVVDLIHYQYRKQEKKLFTMRRELEYLETYMADQYEINLQKVIAQVENNIQKIKSRYETSVSINGRYQKILEKFEEEARSLPQRLEAMENALWRNRMELHDLHATSYETAMDRMRILGELHRITKETSEAASCREKILAETNRRMNQQTADFDRLKRKRAGVSEYHVPTLEPDLADDMEMTKMETLHYQTLFETIKSGTLVPEIKEINLIAGLVVWGFGFVELNTLIQDDLEQPKDLIALLVNMDDILSEQKIRRTEMEKKLMGLRLEKEKLQSAYKELKYSGADRQAMCSKLTEDLKNNVTQLQDKVKKMKKLLKQNGNILVAIGKGIDSMLSKLAGVEMQEKTTDTSESVWDRLRLCTAKLKQLTANVKKESSYQDFQDTMVCTLYQDRLEPVWGDTLPIDLKKRDSLTDYDRGGDTQAPTREDIKKRSKQIIQASQKYPTTPRKK